MKLRRTFTVRLAAVAFVALAAVAPAAWAQETTGPAEGSTAAVDRETQTRPADAESERDIRRIVLTLVGIGIVMAAATVGFWRATRPVAPELDRLAIMGSRGFRRASPFQKLELVGRSPFDRLERLQRGEPLADPEGVGGPPPAVPMAPARVDESDPSLVEPDPAIALERPVLDAEPPDEAVDAEPPDEAVDEEASAGPVTG